MRKSIATLTKPTRPKERKAMMEWPPKETKLELRPMTDEEAVRIDKVLQASRELGKRILARRKGEPLPSSTHIISQARDEYP